MSKHTPLYKAHRALGARMIEFGGWQMPVHYSGILAEHRAVRAQVGLYIEALVLMLSLVGNWAEAMGAVARLRAVKKMMRLTRMGVLL